MRQTTLTLGLGAAAVAAVALAPRLHGWIGPRVQAVEGQTLTIASGPLPPEAVVAAVHTQLEPQQQAPIAELAAPAHPRSAPVSTAIPMKTGPGRHGAIAELDAKPVPVEVEPPPPAPDPDWWSDCQACGMG